MSTPPIGPTGEFPHGKLNEHDQGQLRLAVTSVKGKVLVDFGMPVKWIGFDPQEAADAASAILKHARKAALEAGVTISFTWGELRAREGEP